jgi:hypothetical protein
MYFWPSVTVSKGETFFMRDKFFSIFNICDINQLFPQHCVKKFTYNAIAPRLVSFQLKLNLYKCNTFPFNICPADRINKNP